MQLLQDVITIYLLILTEMVLLTKMLVETLQYLQLLVETLLLTDLGETVYLQ